jgi:putative DNA primase/helicase
MSAPLSLMAIAKALGGVVNGRSVLAPGPGHSAKDRSLSVTPSATASCGFLVHSFAGDDPRICKDYVRGRLGLPAFAPHGRERPRDYRPPPADNFALCMSIWKEGLDPGGTLVQAYLKSRNGVELPGEAWQCIRFHKSCPFSGERFPAMVCLIRNIITNEPQGIHRTALDANGTVEKKNIGVRREGKTYRLSLGQVAGGAVKIDPDEEVTQGLCIGEGVETCLAGKQMGLQPVWSVLSTSGIASFPVLPGIDGLHIFCENDINGASARAVRTCGDRWHEVGRQVLTVRSYEGNDLNDELRVWPCRK